MENTAVLMGEGRKGRVGSRLRGGAGRPLGGCREDVCLVGRSACNLDAAGSTQQGAVSWESEWSFPGPDFSLCPGEPGSQVPAWLE